MGKKSGRGKERKKRALTHILYSDEQRGREKESQNPKGDSEGKITAQTKKKKIQRHEDRAGTGRDGGIWVRIRTCWMRSVVTAAGEV